MDDYYKNFTKYTSEISNEQNKLENQLSNLKETKGERAYYYEFKKKIKENLNYFDELVGKLEEAYSNKNVPMSMPASLLDKRQDEIKKFNITYGKIKQELDDIMREKIFSSN